MVILGKGKEREAEKFMDMAPARSKPLHNFTLPCLKWQNQRFLRCIKVNSDHQVSAADRRSSVPEVKRGMLGGRWEPAAKRRLVDREESCEKSPSRAGGVGLPGKPSKSRNGGDYGMDAIREKLMFDLQAARDEMKLAILSEPLREEAPPPATPVVRQWNLRARRAACKARNGMGGASGGSSNGGRGKSLKADEGKPNFSPLRNENRSPRSTAVEITPPNMENRAGVSLSVPLSRREIEEDFMAMAGRRPPRRPKKRSKTVRRVLDTLFPGCLLTKITTDRYEVPEDPDAGKWLWEDCSDK